LLSLHLDAGLVQIPANVRALSIEVGSLGVGCCSRHLPRHAFTLDIGVLKRGVYPFLLFRCHTVVSSFRGFFFLLVQMFTSFSLSHRPCVGLAASPGVVLLQVRSISFALVPALLQAEYAPPVPRFLYRVSAIQLRA